MGVDFLTLTAGEEAAQTLLTVTEHREPGNPGRGFGASESRDCLGGWCWRRWSPSQPSRDFGTVYESWEWASAVAGSMLAHGGVPLSGWRATRLDIAFDFSVPAEFMPEDFLARVEALGTLPDLKPGVSGQGAVNTRYLGSKDSPRRARIYRRDLREDGGMLIADAFGPTLRLECVLRDEHADALCALWRGGGGGPAERSQAFAAAARTHLADLTGMNLGDLAELPSIRVLPDLDATQQLLAFVEQHASMLDICARMGVPLAELAADRVEVASKQGRSTHRRRLAEWASVDVASVVERVRWALGLPEAGLGMGPTGP
jgi:Replication initiation factor.